MRKILLLLFLLPLAYAAITPTSVYIEVFLNKEGFASVKERYVILFHDKNELNTFENLAKKLGDNFFLWRSSVEGLTYHLGKAYTELRDITLSTRIVPPSLGYVILTYGVQAADKIKDTPTYTEWIVQHFNFPEESGAKKIPDGYTLTIVLPPNAKLISYAPEGEVRGNVITWEGPLTTNDLFVRYLVPKPPKAPSLVELFTSLSFSSYFAIAVLVVAVIVLVKRKTLAKKIEEYVVSNSEFGERE